jgi:Fe-S-cluster-containing dehydrogenase component
MERRDFLKMMGLFSGTMVSSWSWNFGQEFLVSQVMKPEEGVLPGEPVFSFSTCMECPAHCGLMVNSRDGLPVKLEGNPNHPVNRGALCIRGQASLMRLFHPERVRTPLQRGADGRLMPIGWDEALETIRKTLSDARAAGHWNAYLAGHTTGSLAALIDECCGNLGLERLPEVTLYHHGAVRAANEALFGLRRLPQFHLRSVDALLTIGTDLFETYVSPVRFAREFAAKDRPSLAWFHAESGLSLSGTKADRRLIVRAGSEAELLAYLLRHIRLRQPVPPDIMAAVPAVSRNQVAERTGLQADDLDALVQALAKARQPLVLADGPATAQPGGLKIALLAALLQWSLGAIPAAVDFAAAENYDRLGTFSDLQELAARCRRKAPGVVMLSRIHRFDGVPDLPAALEGAGLRVGLTDFLYPAMETCQLILPLSHALESWGDAIPRAGIRSQIRPIFRPMHDSRAEGDILLQLMGRTDMTYKEYLFDRWKPLSARWWKEGVVEWNPDAVPVKLNPEAAAVFQSGPWPAPLQTPVLMVAPSLRSYDGRSRVIPLLHEIPDPLTVVSYGEYAAIPRSVGKAKHLSNGDEVRLDNRDSAWKAAVRLHPALPDWIVQVPVDAAAGLPRTIDRETGELVAVLPGVELVPTGARRIMPILTGSFNAQKRDILPHRDQHEQAKPAYTMFPPHEHKEYRWAMAIDLDKCTGCSACVAACYLENNVKLTGPGEHLIGRELSWIRLEPFFDGSEQAFLIPMMCQQCDDAPCETVCPVFAAIHNEEGLNVQVYNRCVGTRYCSNNCPYKTRRFNWYEYPKPAPLDRLRNPDVSVRPRGVMEKCTFCIQRIRRAKDKARDENRLVRDGEITPACAQTCPAGAITFGNILDPTSRVYALAHDRRAYRVLEELGTRPSVYYLTHRRV